MNTGPLYRYQYARDTYVMHSASSHNVMNKHLEFIYCATHSSWFLYHSFHSTHSTQCLDPFHQQFTSSWSKSQTTICYDVKHDNKIRSLFGTCHDSWAVVTCAKLWPDWIIRIDIRAKKFSQDFNCKLMKRWWNRSHVITKPSKEPLTHCGLVMQNVTELSHHWSS